MITEVMHTGVTVENLNQSVEFYQSLGYEITYQLEKPDMHARLVALKNGTTTIELWQFDGHDHPNYQFIRNHIGIRSTDLDADVKHFIKQGFKVVIPLTEGDLLRYVFVQDKAGLCYEVATDKQSGATQ